MKSYEKIRSLREGKKWSQEQVAEHLGLSPNGYAKIERGETRLTLARLEQIADIFETDILELIRIDGQEGKTYQTGNHNSHNHNPVIHCSRNFTIYGQSDAEGLAGEIERLQAQVSHLQEMLQLKETLLAQQVRELEVMRKLLEKYEA